MAETSLKLLVLEDDDKDFALLEAMLRRLKEWEIEAIRFPTAEAAISGIPETPGEVIFLDYRLSGSQTGHDVLVAIREAGDQRPVIALTGQGDVRTATEFMRKGAADYIPKSGLSTTALRRSISIALTEAHLRERSLMLEAELREAEKMEGVVTLAGGIAHDFNNMLMSLSGNIQLALLKAEEPEVRERLQKTQQICEQMSDTVRKLQSLRPGGFHQLEKINLEDVIDKLRVMVTALAGPKVELNIDLRQTPLTFEGAEAGVRRIVEGIVSNAVESMPEGGRLDIAGYRLDAEEAAKLPLLSDQDHVVLEIRDTGVGIDPKIIGRIFDPFFSTKERGTRKGTGLSLAVIWQHVKEYNGTIDVESHPDRGTTFRVYFPRVTEAGERPADAAIIRDPVRGGETVLLADDEPIVLDATAAMLEHLGYHTLQARDGLQALTLFRERAGEIDAVLLDISMPQMDGIRCFKEIRRVNPDVPVVFLTAHGAENYTEQLEKAGAAAVLDKPIELMVLANRMRQAIGRPR